jgi:asparagine synthase (glutamine-hydrolysing)
MRATRRVEAGLAALRAGGVARTVKRERLTYLSWPKLASLQSAIRRVVRARVPGDFMECGVALGGSGIVLASGLDGERAFHGYDVFGMIPPPGADDSADAHERFEVISAGGSQGLGGDEYYGYVDDLQARVEEAFRRHDVAPQAGRVELHAGLFEDTLHPARPVALAHIDSDWYDPVRLCLERISAQLSPGGAIVVDDYNDYAGCARACHDHLAADPAMRVVRARPHLVLQRC